MRCESCHGTGHKEAWIEQYAGWHNWPCEECWGSGVAHCCDPQDMPDEAGASETT